MLVSWLVLEINFIWSVSIDIGNKSVDIGNLIVHAPVHLFLHLEYHLLQSNTIHTIQAEPVFLIMKNIHHRVISLNVLYLKIISEKLFNMETVLKS